VFYQQALTRIRAIPGVERASVATALPLDLGSGSDMNVDVEGYTPRKDEPMHAYYNRVAPDYFETLGIAIVDGRGISARDTADMPSVAVINETMARRYFRGRSAIGGRLRLGSGPVTIVGVARDGKYAQLNEPPRSYLYLPLLQNYRPEGVLLVRTADPGSVLPSIQRELRALDPGLPLFDVRTIAEHRRVSLFLPTMASTLLGVFGVLAVLLAAVGLYGIVAYTVSQRTKEIGVRVALGATRGDVVTMIVRQGMVIACAGIGIGLGLALVLAGVLQAQLVGVSPRDPVAFIGAPVCLVLLAVLACALPARRAAGLDPLRALRQP
jgi:predicted permease